MTCPGCGKFITGRFNICEECQQKYGRHASDRPLWLNFLISQNQLDKNRERGIIEFSLDYVEEIMSGYPEQRLTGLFREIYPSNARPTEDTALDNVAKGNDEKRRVIKKLIKWAGGIVKDD